MYKSENKSERLYASKNLRSFYHTVFKRHKKYLEYVLKTHQLTCLLHRYQLQTEIRCSIDR